MTSFYTSLENNGSMHRGVVYNSLNNEKVFTSPEFPTQAQAQAAITEFLTQTAENSTFNNAITNIMNYKKSLTASVQPKKCCGR